MSFPSHRLLWWGVGLIGLIGLVASGLALWRWADSQGPATNTASTATHVAYSELYNAAWRQDEGVGSETVTAVLLSPRLQELLHADVQRSDTDDQIARLITDLPANVAVLVVTMDALASSPAARFSDEEVGRALKLSAAGTAFEFDAIRALITPSTVSNSNLSTVRRIWLVAFQSQTPIDWAAARDVQLTISDIGQTKTRILTWARPAALVDAVTTD